MNSLLIIANSIISVCAIIFSIYTLFEIKKIDRIRTEFFGGKQVSALEDFMVSQNNKIVELGKQTDHIEHAIKNLEQQQKFSIQKIGLERYNPFSDDGGNLSFSIAILDGHDNGVVITSMHAREHNRIYAKPVKNGRSEYTLTEEEIKAIQSSKIFK